MFPCILEVNGVTASSADINAAAECANPDCSPVEDDEEEEATTMAMVATTTAASKRRRQAIEDILKAKIV